MYKLHACTTRMRNLIARVKRVSNSLSPSLLSTETSNLTHAHARASKTPLIASNRVEKTTGSLP